MAKARKKLTKRKTRSSVLKNAKRMKENYRVLKEMILFK